MFGRSRQAVDVSTAYELSQDAGYTLLDVRTVDEHRTAHPPGSMHLPLDAVADGWTAMSGKSILTICHSGSRSARAARLLRRSGIEALNVRGGMVAWRRAGLPIKKGR